MNLIVTCPRHFEENTQEEIKNIFEKLDFTEPKTVITNMSGILTVSTKEDSVKIVKKITELVLDEPWIIRYCQRIIPIQKVTDSKIEYIVKNIKEIYCVIKKNETYRITIEKRFSELSSKEIITEIAKNIPNAVSLENPDWIVLVEILGPKSGVSVVKTDEIISIEKIKRSLSE